MILIRQAASVKTESTVCVLRRRAAHGPPRRFSRQPHRSAPHFGACSHQNTGSCADKFRRGITHVFAVMHHIPALPGAVDAHSGTVGHGGNDGRSPFGPFAQVQRAADQSLIERGVELWVYRCEFCGCWHLTHRDPQSSYRHVPLNQQLKPHSRKKGYKPRRR